MNDAARVTGTRARRAARGEVVVPTGAARDPTDAAPVRDPAPGRAPTRRELDPDALAEMEEERDFLLRSLADLEREHAAGDVDDTDFATLEDDYTARAAAVLRAIDARSALIEESRSHRSRGSVIAAVLAVVVLAVGAGWLVRSSSDSRAPGDTTTGDIRESSTGEVAKANALISQAQTALSEGRSADAVSLYQQAIDAYDRALDLDPVNVEAMTYRGWLLHNIALQAPAAAAAELDATAREWLDKAVATDPTFPDARVFRALLLEQAGQLDEALAELDAVDPASLPPGMTDMVDAVRARLEQGSGADTSTQTGG